MQMCQPPSGSAADCICSSAHVTPDPWDDTLQASLHCTGAGLLRCPARCLTLDLRFNIVEESCLVLFMSREGWGVEGVKGEGRRSGRVGGGGSGAVG